jgi:hypothetical protein
MAGVARELAVSGARVVVLDRNFDAAKAVAAEVGGTARELDVTDEAAVDRGCGSNPRSLPTSSGPARRWPRWSLPVRVRARQAPIPNGAPPDDEANHFLS